MRRIGMLGSGMNLAALAALMPMGVPMPVTMALHREAMDRPPPKRHRTKTLPKAPRERKDKVHRLKGVRP